MRVFCPCVSGRAAIIEKPMICGHKAVDPLHCYAKDLAQ